jgi:hypothetical protein
VRTPRPGRCPNSCGATSSREFAEAESPSAAALGLLPRLVLTAPRRGEDETRSEVEDIREEIISPLHL